jgi:4-hydroxymandelate oxidase
MNHSEITSDAVSDPLPPSLPELERAARGVLSGAVYDYYAGGGEDEVTLRGNRRAFGLWHFRPRRLVDVTEVSTETEILGVPVASPVLVAPTAFQRLAHEEGERAMARGAASAGTIMVASTMATRSIEEIADAAGGPLWFQLYVFRDRELTRALIERAEGAGVRALCLTVDVPVQGNRERDDRNRFGLPDGIEVANFRGSVQARFPEAAGSGLGAFIAAQLDPSLTWDFLDWLRSVTDLPLVLKGILTAEDACLAAERGVDALVVSNHGGRQLDGARPTLLALPEVVEAVDGRMPVLLDGGVRRGTDVAKALALGARAVLVGRPCLWGLALAGERGVAHALEILRVELARTLRLLGRTTPEALDRSALAEVPAGLVERDASTDRLASGLRDLARSKETEQADDCGVHEHSDEDRHNHRRHHPGIGVCRQGGGDPLEGCVEGTGHCMDEADEGC